MCLYCNVPEWKCSQNSGDDDDVRKVMCSSQVLAMCVCVCVRG